MASAVHVTADLEGEEARKLGLRLPEVFCVPNGVAWPAQPQSLEAGPFSELARRPYALFLSRISWKKGLDRLIAAWREVPGIELVIAGNDDEGYQPQLEALARSSGIADRVRFVGPVSDEHKWALYQRAALFILPSYSENFGNVVAEAMAMGCPVVVSKDVGIASLVRSSGAGIVPSCEPSELASEVRKLLADEEGRRAMGLRGRRAVEGTLSWDAVAARMEDVYWRLALNNADRSLR
jgi:glycosyltransferase involved in cell wall biosynthesis